MKKNIICDHFSETKILCSKCQSDPFAAEEFRSFLARNKKFDILKKTYRGQFAQIKDINSSKLWNSLIEEQYIETKSPIVKERIKTVLEMLLGLRGKLLDVGMGYGVIERVLFKKGRYKLYGIDISPRAVEDIRKSVKGIFRVGSILKIPYPANSFDIVLALEILEHIPLKNTFKAIGEIYRVLRKDGILIVSLPLNENLAEKYQQGINPNAHVRVYTSELIVAELEIGSFTIQKTKYLFAFKNMYKIKNFLRKFFLKNRWKPNNVVILSKK